MKLKYSIIFSLSSILLGLFPLSYDEEKHNITYTIYSKNIVKANKIKEELIVFYKDNCYSSLLLEIDKKIVETIDNFPYRCEYKNQNLIIYDSLNTIKMTGYLYQDTPSFIDFKYYFSSSINSIPEATSTSIETSKQSDQI